MENFVYKRKALHLFRSIMIFRNARQDWGKVIFIWPVFSLKISHSSLCIAVKRAPEKADPGIGQMMCLSNYYMQPWLLMRHMTLLEVIRFGLTVQWVSAALPREDQTCACTWRTWTKILWFCRFSAIFERCKDFWRQVTFSLSLSVRTCLSFWGKGS